MVARVQARSELPHESPPWWLSRLPAGAGKTYTMLGMDAEPGIYLQTLTDLFRAIEETRGHADCSVSMSYLEVSLPAGLLGDHGPRGVGGSSGPLRPALLLPQSYRVSRCASPPRFITR